LKNQQKMIKLNCEGLKPDFRVYPNPFKHKIYLKFDDANHKEYDMVCNDIYGNTLFVMKIDANVQVVEITDKCAHLKSGIYYLSVSEDEGMVSRKVIKL